MVFLVHNMLAFQSDYAFLWGKYPHEVKGCMEKQRKKTLQRSQMRCFYVQLEEGGRVQLLLLLHKMRAWIYLETVFLGSRHGEIR